MWKRGRPQARMRCRIDRITRCSLWLLLSPTLVLVFVALWTASSSSFFSSLLVQRTTDDTFAPDVQCNNKNICGKCPELIEAAKYYRDHYHDNATISNTTTTTITTTTTTRRRPWRVQMMQLVGTWPTDPEMAQVMYDVFAHNRRMIKAWHDTNDDTLLLEPVAIHEPPTVIPLPCRHQVYSQQASAAYWKPMAIYQKCTTTPFTSSSAPAAPDLVWFLDGDALVMDGTARVDFLWAYHHSRQPRGTSTTTAAPMDMLFAHGKNGYNSGIFVVNCTSSTALQTLQLWHDVALDLLEQTTAATTTTTTTSSNSNNTTTTTSQYQNHFRNRWYEQNALHYMLDTHQWRVQGLSRSGSDQVPRTWDTHFSHTYAYLGLDTSQFTTTALQQRLRHTTQCALQTFAPSFLTRKNNRYPYSPGHFILHTAGVPREPRLMILKRYTTRGRYTWATTTANSSALTVWQAAEAYLQSHAYTYHWNETYLDWDYPQT